MGKIYITVTGTQYRHGQEFLEPGAKLRLVKEPDNRHDREAIRVEMEGLGHIGYVANSTYTVLGESFSAGRLYDRIGDTARARVVTVLPRGVLCAVRKKDLLYWPPEPDRKRTSSPAEAALTAGTDDSNGGDDGPEAAQEH